MSVQSAALANEGYCRVRGIFSEYDATELGLEADRLRDSAVSHSWDRYAIDEVGKVSSPRRHRTSVPGPFLHGAHESPFRVEFLRRLTGRTMVPTRASFLYYGHGDVLGLHTDVPACQIAILLSVRGAPGPLIVHKDLEGKSPAELLTIARESEGAPLGGRPVPVGRTTAVVLRGSEVPHHRPQVESGEAVIVTMCYASIV